MKEPPESSSTTSGHHLFFFQLEIQVSLLEKEVLSLSEGPLPLETQKTLSQLLAAIEEIGKLGRIHEVADAARAMEIILINACEKGKDFRKEEVDFFSEGIQTLQEIVRSRNSQPSERRQKAVKSFVKGTPREKEKKVKKKKKESKSTQQLSLKPFLQEEVDTSLIELFRSETEAQTSFLNEGLIAVEGHVQGSDTIHALMRAAHSVKGAARAAKLELFVALAHTMEDCFVAAQEKRIVFEETTLDLLFRGVDIMTRFCQLDSSELFSWLGTVGSEIGEVVASLEKVLSRRGRVEKSIPQKVFENRTEGPPEKKALVKGAEKVVQDSAIFKPPLEKERVLRVTAQNLNRLMGLAGESLIESRWLEPFGKALLQQKESQDGLAGSLETLKESLQETQLNDRMQRYLMELQQKIRLSQSSLANRLVEFEMFVRRQANLSDRLYREVIDSRMQPFGDGVIAFPRMVRDLAKQLGKKVKLEILGKATSVDRDILERLEAPLGHLLRNAVDHGIERPEERLKKGKLEEGKIVLEASHKAGMLVIIVWDDGQGIDIEELREEVVAKNLVDQRTAKRLKEEDLVKFLFLPSFSTAEKVTEISGRGVGLNVVQNMVHEVGGIVQAHFHKGYDARFYLQLPLTLSVIKALIVEISKEAYAFPLARIDKVLSISKNEIETAEGRQYFHYAGQNIGLIPAYQILELECRSEFDDVLPVVVLSDESNVYGVVVDAFLGEKELVVQELPEQLGKVRDISAGAFMEDGSLILIIDVEDMVTSIDSILSERQLREFGRFEETEKQPHPKHILVVDDSITVREVESRLLQNCGYLVSTAVDGMEGWSVVRERHFDLVITDVDMPRMNGIEFVRAIKGHSKLKSLPVVIVSYKEREEDRLLGMEAGADYYLTKSNFHDEAMIDIVKDLIGKP